MSIRVMSDIWDNAKKLEGSCLLVMLAMADHCNEERNCWPSIKKLAEKARISERQTQRIIRALEDAGYITVALRGSEHMSNKYTIVSAPFIAGLSAPALSNNWSDDTGDVVTPVSGMGDASDTREVTHVAPQPSVNHQEPSLLPPKAAGKPRVDPVALKLGEHFTSRTGISPPKCTTASDYMQAQALWWKPLVHIVELCRDVGGASDLVTRVVDKMRKDKMIISSPKSIVNVAISLAAEVPKASTVKEW